MEHKRKALSTALYRHFCEEGKLLYVGVSLGPIARLKQHVSSGSAWVGKIARIEITYYENRDLALKAETQAIRKEDPIYNRTTSSTSQKGDGIEFCRIAIPVPLWLKQWVREEAEMQGRSSSAFLRTFCQEIADANRRSRAARRKTATA